MQSLMLINKKQLKWHILGWGLVIVWMITKGSFNGTLAATIVGRFLFFCNYLFAFYSISFFVFPKFWPRPILLISGILIDYILFWSIGAIISSTIVPALGGAALILNKMFWGYTNFSFYYFFITTCAATASFFSRYGHYKLKQQAEKEKLLISKEISFLKTQFNSRLTFDFLDYCNRSIKPHSPETAESVALFSDMLKYTLQTQPNERVPLKNEISYIENFIGIQKLLSSNVYVNFNYKGNADEKQIIPRILITFVENAFKHGLFNNAQYPIDIYLTVENNRLLLNVKNKTNPNKKIISSHTGLENVKQALELHYAGKYELKLGEEEGFYNVELSMES